MRFKRPFHICAVPPEISEWARDFAKGPHDLNAYSVELGSHVWFAHEPDAMQFWLEWGSEWLPL
jgi:hypothetical protein